MTDAGNAPLTSAPRDHVSPWVRLFFIVHPDGRRELDLGWLILAIAFLNGLVMWDFAAICALEISTAAWSWYGAVISMAFIAGTTVSRARLMARSSMIGAVAQGIGAALELDRDPGRHADEERIPIVPGRG